MLVVSPPSPPHPSSLRSNPSCNSPPKPTSSSASPPSYQLSSYSFPRCSSPVVTQATTFTTANNNNNKRSPSPDHPTKLILNNNSTFGNRSSPTSATSPVLDVGVVNSLLLIKQQQLLKQQLQAQQQISPPLPSSLSVNIPPIVALSSSTSGVGSLSTSVGNHSSNTVSPQQLHEYQLQQQQMLHAAYHRHHKQQQSQHKHYPSYYSPKSDILNTSNPTNTVDSQLTATTPPYQINSTPTAPSMPDSLYPPTPTPTVSTVSTNSTSTTPTISTNTSNPTPPLSTPPNTSTSGGSASSGGGGSLNTSASGSNLAAHHPLLGYIPHGGNKILSRNLNGTLAVTTQPSNESELQLYRVLQRANLLTYYDVFISQGGDDVQQLCEAGEDEFLEIMALVGMATKPLHVRRLQKALQEWVTNPSLFQIPLLPNLPASAVAGFSFSSRTPPAPNASGSTPTRPSPPSSSTLPTHQRAVSASPGLKDSFSRTDSSMTPTLAVSRGNSPTLANSLSTVGHSSLATLDRSPPEMLPHMLKNCSPTRSESSDKSLTRCSDNDFNADYFVNNLYSIIGNKTPSSSYIQNILNNSAYSPLNFSKSNGSPNSPSFGKDTRRSTSPLSQNSSPNSNPFNQITQQPTLDESQIARLSQVASELACSLPSLEPKKDPLANKKKNSSEFELIMSMSENDPRRLEEIRKYAAIYGRFDCKRKAEKPLTLHEVSVNEAAAQICKYIPSLLTRRDELFPLARQIVRDSGYQYSKGHSRSQTVVGGRDEDMPRIKKQKTDSDGGTSHDIKPELTWEKKQKRLEQIGEELRLMSEKAEEVRLSLTNGTGDVMELTNQMDALQQRHGVLTIEQNDLMKDLRNGPPEESKPTTRNNDDCDVTRSEASSPNQVISASQGNIIAVANPALNNHSNQVNRSNGDDENNHHHHGYNSPPIKQEPGSPNTTKS